jgi:hypothetical protein
LHAWKSEPSQPGKASEPLDLNPSRAFIRGVVCGVRVEDIEDPVMREIRYLDKLIDEIAKGKAMENSAKAVILTDQRNRPHVTGRR